jgi:DNA-binding SARP family transcriptional activator
MVSSSLALFGTPTVSRGSVVVHGLRHKSLALLGYLAVESRPVARDTLATLFWPSSGQSRARANLRSCVWQLSESVGPRVLRVRGDTLSVDVNELLVDVHEFRRLTSTHRRSETDHSDSSRPRGQFLAEAERLYRGSFMEGFTLTDCPEFDTWELFQEELFRRQHSSVLTELIELRVEQGQWNEAVRVGERLIELDPLEEESHRQLMRVLARSGRRAAALRQYEACVRVVASELDDDPEPETVRLMEGIKAGSEHTRPEHARKDHVPGIGIGHDGMPPSAPVPLPTESTSFVGRTRSRSGSPAAPCLPTFRW